MSGKDPVQCAPRESTNSGFDDADYNYIIQIGELWDSRYRVCRILGQGSFGKVVEAFDLVDRRSYAIKIIKNRKAFYQQALLEIEILGYLNKTDGADTKNIGKFVSLNQYVYLSIVTQCV